MRGMQGAKLGLQQHVGNNRGRKALFGPGEQAGWWGGAVRKQVSELGLIRGREGWRVGGGGDPPSLYLHHLCDIFQCCGT